MPPKSLRCVSSIQPFSPFKTKRICVARLLLHNTRLMMSLSGRPTSLFKHGWIQEHWSIAPRRGIGMSQIYLSWATVSHTCGIVELEDFDAELYRQFTSGIEQH